MELFRYASSIYGGTEIIGASFELLDYFVLAGVLACVIHAVYKFVVPSKHHS